MTTSYNPDPQTDAERAENELWALRVNYEDSKQFEIDVAARLEQLALKVGVYYIPPRHDPKCPLCITVRALKALEVYFAQDPIEVLSTEAEKGYDAAKLIPRRNTLEPGLSKNVIYRSRTGGYDCAAIIVATRSSLNMENVAKGYIPMISEERNVHLVIFSAGKMGQGRSLAEAEKDFLVKSEHGASANVSGTYQEWDIPFDPEGGPGTWRWPE